MKNLFIGAIALFLLTTTTACDGDGWGIFDGGKRIKGKGAVEKFERDAKDFTGVHLSASANVFVRQAGAFKVVVEGQKNIADVFETTVENGILNLKFKSGSWSLSYETLNVYIETPSVSSLNISGSGDMTVESAFKGDDLAVKISGSGNFKSSSNLTFNKLTVAVVGSGDAELSSITSANVAAEVSGSGNVTLGGSSENVKIEVTGSGDVKAIQLTSKRTEATVTGSGNISCNAEESLDARASGSGDITYSGNASSVKSKASGSGNISKQ